MQQDRDGGHRHGNGGTRHRGDIKGAPHTGSACGQWACGYAGMFCVAVRVIAETSESGLTGVHVGTGCIHTAWHHQPIQVLPSTPPPPCSSAASRCRARRCRDARCRINISLNTDQTVQGRGFALPGCMQLLDARHGPLAPAFLSLMREVSSKEAACLCRARGFGTVAVHSPMVATHGDSSRQSINQLAAALVEGLQVWMSGEGLVMGLQV